MSLKKLTRKRLALFAEELKKHGNVSRAAEQIGMARRYLYSLRETHPELKAVWDDSVETFLDVCDSECTKRAVLGWDEPVYQGGQKVGDIHKASDRLLEFILERRRYPKRHEISGRGGGPIPTVDLSKLSDEHLEHAKAIWAALGVTLTS